VTAALRLAAMTLAVSGGLAGCMSLSRSEPVAALSPEVARGAYVDQMSVLSAAKGLSPEFEAVFRARVGEKLRGCATGTRPLRLEARIDRLDKADPVATAVIGGANVLRGSARLVDVQTGEVVGDYRIGSTVIGGRLAVFRMAEAEEQMSDRFGEELCKQAFGESGGKD